MNAINGIKMEVDLRNAKVIDSYKVGDPIKVLVKGYSDSYNSYIGVIIGFDNFKNLPCIVIAYLEIGYGTADIKIISFNDKTENIKVTNLNDWDAPMKKADVFEYFNQRINKLKLDILEWEHKKDSFLTLFGKVFDKKLSSVTNLD